VQGYTATPDYHDNKKVQLLLGTELLSISLKEAIKDGFCSGIREQVLNSDVSLQLDDLGKFNNNGVSEAKLRQAIKHPENDNALEAICEEVANGIFDVTVKNKSPEEQMEIFAKDIKKTMVNCWNIAHAELQAKTINRVSRDFLGIDYDIAVAYHSGNKDYPVKKNDRREILRRFDAPDFRDEAKPLSEKEHYKVICQVNALTEGFDDNKVVNVFQYPIKSLNRYEQSIGRAIRLDKANPDKVANVIDIVTRLTDSIDTDNSATRARKNKQILLSDILEGKVSVENKNGGKSNPNPTGGGNTPILKILGVNIESSLEVLAEHIRKDKELQNNEFIPDDYLSNVDLSTISENPEYTAKYSYASSTKVNEILEQLDNDVEARRIWKEQNPDLPYPVMHGKKKGLGGASTYHLSPDGISLLEQAFGFAPSDWLSTIDLSSASKNPEYKAKYSYTISSKVNEILEQLDDDVEARRIWKEQNPDLPYPVMHGKKKGSHGSSTYHLSPDGLSLLDQAFGFVPKECLNNVDLSCESKKPKYKDKYSYANSTKVKEVLEKLYQDDEAKREWKEQNPDLPYPVMYGRKKGGRGGVTTCHLAPYGTVLLEKAFGFVPNDWLSNRDLSNEPKNSKHKTKYSYAKSNKVKDILEQLDNNVEAREIWKEQNPDLPYPVMHGKKKGSNGAATYHLSPDGIDFAIEHSPALQACIERKKKKEAKQRATVPTRFKSEAKKAECDDV